MTYHDTPFKYRDGKVKCHLAADTIAELHSFAASIGLKRCWFQNKQGKNQPHYDLVGHKIISLAKENGAIFVTRKELFTFLKEHYASRNIDSRHKRVRRASEDRTEDEGSGKWL